MATDAQKFMVIDAHVDEESGSILIDGFEPITETGGTLNLMYKVYNPEPKPHFEDDAERKEKCVKALEETFKADFDAVIADPSVLVGLEFDGYPSDERIYLTPAKEFITFSKVTPAVAKAVEALIRKGDIISTPVVDNRRFGLGKKSGAFYSSHSFDFAVPVKINGETLYVRVAQIIDDTADGDKVVKYATNYKGATNGGFKDERGYTRSDADQKLYEVVTGAKDADPQLKDSFIKFANTMLDQARTILVQSVLGATGVDLDAYAAEEKPVRITNVRIESAGNNQFLTASIAPIEE